MQMRNTYFTFYRNGLKAALQQYYVRMNNGVLTDIRRILITADKTIKHLR